MNTPLAQARRDDSQRRRLRVTRALEQLSTSRSEISISSVARAANVHRSFIHRHGDLRVAILAAASTPAIAAAGQDRATSASIKAENEHLRQNNRRLQNTISSLEQRMSELLGEQVHRRSGLGDPEQPTLQNEVARLEQEVHSLTVQLAERNEELSAVREANRRMMTELNR